ncbi:MAG: methyltransferase domain-containing protein [bacterium]|nr:methyltransferase domain-containing protein [bacterium]
MSDVGKHASVAGRGDAARPRRPGPRPGEPYLTEFWPAYARGQADAGPLKRLLFSVLPQHTLRPLRSELRMAAIRCLAPLARRRYRRSRDLRINLGCGAEGRPDWINVDAYRLPGVNCLADCRRRLPFPDASARAIYCEHFFEHVDYTEEVPYFLAECHRVLEAGGVLRIIVPDAGAYLDAYQADGWEGMARLRQLGPDHHDPFMLCTYGTKLELVNMVFRQGYEHQFAYDFETLRMVLLRSGFSEVHRQGCGRSLREELVLDQPWRASESLYVDAVR